MIAPMMVGLMIMADKLVTLVLTDKWSMAVPYIRIFCMVYLLYPIHTANLNAIKALGRSDIFLRLEIIKKILGLIILIIGIKIGPEAIAYGLLLCSFINQFVNAYPNRSLLGYTLKEQMTDIAPPIVLSCIMAAGVILVGRCNLPVLLTVVLQAVTGVILYIVLSAALKVDTYVYLKNLLRSYRTRT